MIKFLKSWKFMVGFFVVLTVVVVVSLVYGITTHTEPGFLPDVPRWERTDFPLGVCASSYANAERMEGDDFEALNHAISTTNERLGFHALERARNCTPSLPPQVVVTIGVPHESDWGDMAGSAEIAHREGHAYQCAVITTNVFGEMLSLVLQHEFGHCFGLAHDDFNLSIMRPVQGETPDGAFPPRITDSDRELLRETYGPP